MAFPHVHSASAAVVEQFPVRPRPLCPQDIDGLASSLLDLCSGHEIALRTVIAMQRNLERVRRCGEASPERSLLLQEIARQLDGLREGCATLADRMGGADHRLDALRDAAGT